jgi:hypothetical protein
MKIKKKIEKRKQSHRKKTIERKKIKFDINIKG